MLKMTRSSLRHLVRTHVIIGIVVIKAAILENGGAAKVDSHGSTGSSIGIVPVERCTSNHGICLIDKYATP